MRHRGQIAGREPAVAALRYAQEQSTFLQNIQQTETKWREVTVQGKHILLLLQENMYLRSSSLAIGYFQQR